MNSPISRQRDEAIEIAAQYRVALKRIVNSVDFDNEGESGYLAGIARKVLDDVDGEGGE